MIGLPLLVPLECSYMDSSVTVVILAAGLGTRMKSRKAKVLHRVGGASLLENVVGTALSVAPPERVVAVVGHQAPQVRQEVKHLGIQFVLQAEQKGTGHALLCCREQVSGQGGLLIVLYGDCPLLTAATVKRLVARQVNDPYTAGALITTTLQNPAGYGRIILDSEGNVEAIVEEKACSAEQRALTLVNTGMYCFRADLLWKYIGQIQTNNPAGEYYLTDIVQILGENGYALGAMHLDDSSEVLGINTRPELAEADRVIRWRKVRELMLAGVTIEKPETVTIDTGVSIGMDTVVEPFTQILGKTTIGDNCRIGACSIIRDSQLGNEVEVGPFTIIGTSTMEDGAHAGPFSRLRQENYVEAGAHIGNFVELKKVRLGAGSKAMHLAYLGDAEIGSNVNVGAGTITCNYDGRKKHKTVIGDGAFVGSNSTIVAPVIVGPGSYIGAGSVVTKEVPADALALGRGRQVNKTGWAANRRAGKQG